MPHTSVCKSQLWEKIIAKITLELALGFWRSKSCHTSKIKYFELLLLSKVVKNLTKITILYTSKISSALRSWNLTLKLNEKTLFNFSTSSCSSASIVFFLSRNSELYSTGKFWAFQHLMMISDFFFELDSLLFARSHYIIYGYSRVINRYNSGL